MPRRAVVFRVPGSRRENFQISRPVHLVGNPEMCGAGFKDSDKRLAPLGHRTKNARLSSPGSPPSLPVRPARALESKHEENRSSNGHGIFGEGDDVIRHVERLDPAGSCQVSAVGSDDCADNAQER